MTLAIRPIEAVELHEFMTVLRRTFGWPLPSDQELEVVGRSPDTLPRSLAVFEKATIRATAGAFSFNMTVPGGSLPTAGVTRVTVASTHRRRGLLTAMMRRQLDDIRERGEPLAILYASEAPIYGRFGYGVGTLHSDLTVVRGAEFASPVETRGSVGFVDADRALTLFPEIWEAVKPQQPGMVTRDSSWWGAWLADAPERRPAGATSHYLAVYTEGRHRLGFTAYRIRQQWTDHRPAGTLIVEQLIAASPAAYSALWRFLLEMDLITTVVADARPADESLVLMLGDIRQAQHSVHDGIWLRLVDVAAALGGRGYAAEAVLRLRVSDRFCSWNEGTFELEAKTGAAECRPAGGDADLALTASALASAYLGGFSFRRLARAGLVEELRPGALALADAMFASDPPPWCPVHF